LTFSPYSGTYDFIVIGAGSAGSIFVSRLARYHPESKILLREAGHSIPFRDKTVWDPARWSLVRQGSQYEWGYMSVKQSQLHGRTIPMSRAKGLGGCGLHNAMVYVRGGKSGYHTD
jgi:choline dehydrogenase